MNKIKVIKKNGQKVDFNCNKIKHAIRKSADRVLVTLSKKEEEQVCVNTIDQIKELGFDEVSVAMLHNLVEISLESVNKRVAESYRSYRDYKTDFVAMIDEAYQKANSILLRGDRENSNTDSSLVSSRRVLTYNEFNKLLYRKFFLNSEERSALEDGYIYCHDESSRRDTYNCCLFDAEKVMDGGFEMGNMWYNECTTIDKALDVLGDIMTVKASQQYGGLTIPEVDKTLAPYLKKSHTLYRDIMIKEAEELYGIMIVKNTDLYDKINKMALDKAKTELEDGIQGIEYKANSVASSRGDYPFLTWTFGENTDDEYAVMVAEAILKVRKEGQGKKGKKKCVLFPKLVFLYVEEKHGEGKPFEFLYNEAIDCSAKCMHPDYLSLSGEGYVASIYKKYGKIISPMGCRAFLSPWFEKGGMYPADENDVPVFVGRFNIGAVSLHLPMIYQKAKQEGKDFYEVLDYYLEMIRKIHLRTWEYLGEMKASMDPLAFCEGGFYGGNLGLDDKIAPVLESSTASFGITALNELQQLATGKTIVEDNSFAKEVMVYINKKVDQYKKEDGRLYAIYGTPAESLCGKQVVQFKKKYGEIEGFTDKEYVSNSFHCAVSENITGVEKQDRENEFWDLFNGGKIQYVKYPMGYNTEAISTLVRRAMKLGLYEGVNLSLAFCDDCGHTMTSATNCCEHCGSTNITCIERMNGYLSYSRVKGKTRLNDAKMSEIKERVSM